MNAQQPRGSIKETGLSPKYHRFIPHNNQTENSTALVLAYSYIFIWANKFFFFGLNLLGKKG
jgi:hypothetical protein